MTPRYGNQGLIDRIRQYIIHHVDSTSSSGKNVSISTDECYARSVRTSDEYPHVCVVLDRLADDSVHIQRRSILRADGFGRSCGGPSLLRQTGASRRSSLGRTQLHAVVIIVSCYADVPQPPQSLLARATLHQNDLLPHMHLHVTRNRLAFFVWLVSSVRFPVR